MRLTRSEKWMVYTSSIGVWLSGVLWVWYIYFMRVEGEFGIERSPLEGVWQKFHGGFGYAAAFVAGSLWTVHVVRSWKLRWRRWSGGTIFGIAIFLSVTGCALYYVGDDLGRKWIGIAHWAVGLAALAAFLIHWLSRSRPPKAPPR